MKMQIGVLCLMMASAVTAGAAPYWQSPGTQYVTCTYIMPVTNGPAAQQWILVDAHSVCPQTIQIKEVNGDYLFKYTLLERGKAVLTLK
jgi:hypothetical protein